MSACLFELYYSSSAAASFARCQISNICTIGRFCCSSLFFLAWRTDNKISEADPPGKDKPTARVGTASGGNAKEAIPRAPDRVNFPTVPHTVLRPRFEESS